VVRARLLLYSRGIGTVDIASPLRLLDRMQRQLRMLLPGSKALVSVAAAGTCCERLLKREAQG
jgi:hypothetical protein